MNPLFGLEPLDFIFLIIVPLVLLIVGLSSIVIHNGRRRRDLAIVAELSERIAGFRGRTMDNRPALEELIAEHPDGAVEQALSRLLREADLKYENRWLPPLEHELRAELLPEFAVMVERRMKLIPAFLAAGLLSSFVLFLAGKTESLAPAAWLPTAVAVLLSVIFLLSDKQGESRSKAAMATLMSSLAGAFPVFNDRAGVALLVEDLLSHESSMQRAFNDFNETARYLADAEFSAGIEKSVRQVMSQEISPPIKDSAKLLHELSERLIGEQREGMRNLAGEFSQAVAAELKSELNPIATELCQLSELIADTREFIHDSVAVLETSRQQNIGLNQELTESLRLMTVAKNDLANEMNEISANLEIISRTTEKMAAIYAGEEARLADRIKQLSSSMNSAFNTLVQALESSGKSLELAATVRSDQEGQNQALVASLEAVSNELNVVAESLSHSSQNFTRESGEYVNQTLQSFDSGLAEVVERLIFTASAIRDAVDALPVALRPNRE
ncbi:MAG: hypothetical protein Q4P08_03815 [Eubacteriales bacterium]|nr:hypothetical protein [Eubacteriales bacterium]